MPPFPRWADLIPELLCRIGDHLDLKGYTGARGACMAWRRALVPLSPTLLVLAADHDDDRWCRPYAASLPTRRSLAVADIASRARCVGSSNGWLALSVVDSRCHGRMFGYTHPLACHVVFVLLNPVAAVEILLPPLVYESRWVSKVSKVVFAPRPAKDDFAAAAICEADRVAYVTAGARKWAVTEPVRLAVGDHLVDVVYADQGKAAAVYCLTNFGDVHVLRLPDRRQRLKPDAANVGEAAAAGTSEPSSEFSLLRPPQHADEQRTIGFIEKKQRTIDLQRPLQWQPNFFRMMRFGRQALTRDQDPAIPMFFYDEETPIPSSVASLSKGPHLNEPATIDPLLSEANLPFNPATVFAPPYHTVSSFTSAKNLVFCDGNLYQVWRNDSCTVTLQLPAGGGQRCVAEHEILVLRYYPDKRQQPCWDVVKDLGGHSFFVRRNNAVSVYAKGVPGLRGNCVYWIGGRGRDQGMVYDMESGRSTPVGIPAGHPHSIICWYFLNDRCM